MKRRCLECNKEFDPLKLLCCCKGSDSVMVAGGLTFDEMMKAVSDSNENVYDLLFQSRDEIERLQEKHKRLSASVKLVVSELNKLEYIM